ncbi:uncharacterized protein EDB93DRAFT_1102196 [Suillus bovinus]|uniref:uncharacterized protein n=1 Tax=Suillus bovinus TaxID=48563 RepID=UPI001B85EDFE|nr:uncharacterized protein EDB93DRAFT_1102196 [Suillus bovinus]KAG2154407.1 hypothetical protein EDB93DRAFT_1102196 [Suillus bovinus]
MAAPSSESTPLIRSEQRMGVYQDFNRKVKSTLLLLPARGQGIWLVGGCLQLDLISIAEVWGKNGWVWLDWPQSPVQALDEGLYTHALNKCHTSHVHTTTGTTTKHSDFLPATHQAWENDNSQCNPFESHFARCRTSTARELQAGINMSLHTDISPSRLITSGTDLQDQQKLDRQCFKVDIANMSLQKHPPPHRYQHLHIRHTLMDATSKHHPAPTRHADSPASSIHAQTTPAFAGVARTHTEDTRMKREGKEEEQEEEGRILSCAPANLPVPPLLPVPTTYVRVTSANADVCWTYVLSTGSDTYGTHG